MQATAEPTTQTARETTIPADQLAALRSQIIADDHFIFEAKAKGVADFNITITDAAEAWLGKNKKDQAGDNLVLVAHRSKVDVSAAGDGSEMKLKTVAVTIHTIPTIAAFNRVPDGKKMIEDFATKALFSKLNSALGSDSPTPVSVADYTAEAQRGDPLASKMLANLAKQASQLRVYDGLGAINDRSLRKALMSQADAEILFPDAVAAVPAIFDAINKRLVKHLNGVERTDSNTELLDYMLAKLDEWEKARADAPATVEVKVKSLADLML